MSTPPPPTPPPDEESLWNHIVRSTKNGLNACCGCIQTSDEKAKIAYKEYLIKSRKQQLGVEYMDLVHAKAEEHELKNCVEKCSEDIAKLQAAIDELQAEIERVETETKSKIVPPKAGAKKEDKAKPAAGTEAKKEEDAPKPAAEATTKPEATAEPTMDVPADKA